MNWLRSYRYTFIGLFWTLTLAAQPTQSLSGRVLGYLANQVGDYDGLRLRTTTGVTWFHFPPHTAAQVLKLAPVGQTVVATGIRYSPPPARTSDGQEAAPVYRLTSLVNRSRKTSLQIADLPPPPPAQGKLAKAEGPLTGELRDDAGRLSALVTDQYVIDLKPHQSESIQALLEGVHRLGVVGYERTAVGFVNKTGRKLIHPTALTINGQTFAL
ncbi:hypothetical protein [Spirosoma pomorum]